MIKCTKCGTECKDDMRFCLNCGDPLSQPKNKAEKKSKGNGKRAAVLSAVLAGSVLLGGGGIAADYFIKQGSIAPTVQQGNSLIDEKKYEEAVYSFDKALKLDPKNTDAYLGKAKALSGAGFYDLAETVLSEGIKNCSADTESVSKLSEFRTQLLDMKKTHEDKTAATDPTDTQPVAKEDADITDEKAENEGGEEAPEKNDSPELKPVNKEYIRIDEYYPYSYAINSPKTGDYATRTVENGEVVEKAEETNEYGAKYTSTKIYRPIKDSVDEMYVSVSSNKSVWDGYVGYDYTSYNYYDEWHDKIYTDRTEGILPPGGGSYWYECYDEEAKITAHISVSDMDGYSLSLYEYDSHDNIIALKDYSLKYEYSDSFTTDLLNRNRTVVRELTGIESHWGSVKGVGYEKDDSVKTYIFDVDGVGECLYINDTESDRENIYPMTVSDTLDYTYEYNSSGDIISCVKNIKSEYSGEYTERIDNTYNSEGRLIQSVTKNSLNGSSTIQTYGYDKNGGLTKDIKTSITIENDGTLKTNSESVLRDGITDITIYTVVVDGIISSMNITKTQYGFLLLEEVYERADIDFVSPIKNFVKGNANSIRVDIDEYGLLTRVYKVDKGGKETDSVIIDYIRNDDGEIAVQALAIGNDAAVANINGGVTEYADYSYDDNGNPISGTVYNKATGEIISTLNASYCKKDEVFK